MGGSHFHVNFRTSEADCWLLPKKPFGTLIKIHGPFTAVKLSMNMVYPSMGRSLLSLSSGFCRVQVLHLFNLRYFWILDFLMDCSCLLKFSKFLLLICRYPVNFYISPWCSAILLNSLFCF